MNYHKNFVIERIYIDQLINGLINNINNPNLSKNDTVHLTLRNPPGYHWQPNDILLPNNKSILEQLLSQFQSYKDSLDSDSNLEKIYVYSSDNIYSDFNTPNLSYQHVFYVFGNGVYIGQTDFISHMYSTDPQILEEEINREIKKLDYYGITYTRLDNGFYIQDVDFVIRKYYLQNFNNYDRSAALSGTNRPDVEVLLNKYPHLVFDVISQYLEYFPDYMQFAKEDITQQDNLYDLGVLFLREQGENYDLETIQEVNLMLANNLISRMPYPSDNNKILILDHLVRAGNLPQAKTLRNELFWSWADRLDNRPFDINIDGLTFFRIIQELKRK